MVNHLAVRDDAERLIVLNFRTRSSLYGKVQFSSTTCLLFFSLSYSSLLPLALTSPAGSHVSESNEFYKPKIQFAALSSSMSRFRSALVCTD